jgi:hypothetical protein
MSERMETERDAPVHDDLTCGTFGSRSWPTALQNEMKWRQSTAIDQLEVHNQPMDVSVATRLYC